MPIENAPSAVRSCTDPDKMDADMMAEDVVFTIMATGQEHRGREAVIGMFDYYFHVAFDATSETTCQISANRQTVVEGYFVGKHTGEFAGIPATQKQVRVPLAVVYDLEGDQIKHGRIYLEMFALLRQIEGIEGPH